MPRDSQLCILECKRRPLELYTVKALIKLIADFLTAIKDARKKWG